MHPLTLNNIHFAYDDKTLIDNLSLEIQAGKLTVILGPNGSGKTTLIKLMSKVLTAQSGQVAMYGQDMTQMIQKNISQTLAIVPQNTAVEFEFSVEEIVAMGRYPHLKRFAKEGQNDQRIIENAMKSTDVYRLKDRAITALSGGEVQRVIIARALAQEPKILILDEPISHLDIQHQLDLLQLVKSLSVNHQMTVVMILHDLNYAMSFADQVILMHDGAIAAQGQPTEVLTATQIKHVYGVDTCIVKHPTTGKNHILPFI